MVTEGGLSTWRLRSAVLQANTISGWRYLDLTGVVVNRLSAAYEQVQVSAEGTILSAAKIPDGPTNIQFSPHRIILRYIPLDSLRKVKDTAYDIVRSVAEDLEVSQFSRLGFRCQYFIPTDNFGAVSQSYLNKTRSQFLADLPATEEEGDAASGFEFRFPFRSGFFDVILRLSAIKVAKPSNDPASSPSDGIIFDADVFQRGEFRRNEASKFLNDSLAKMEQLVETVGIPILEGVPI